MPAEKGISIPIPENFSFPECLWYLDRNYDDCLHRIRGDVLLKALQVNGQPVLVSITEVSGALQAAILSGEMHEGGLESVRDHITGWLDLGRDLTPFYALLKKDRRLAYLSAEYKGLRLVGIADLFEALAWSIIGQQINLRFAYTLKRRLVEAYGERFVYERETYYLFPSFHRLAGTTVTDLRAMQFSENKARYLIALSEAFAGGKLSRTLLDSLPDCESRRAALMELKGIGIWTANYCLMKTMREPSCIPHGDTGLLTALTNHSIIKERSETAKIERFFKKYPGWESYLVFYLWRSLAGPGRKEGA
jgi:DNA-3-methyladenine glycosylase II